MQIDFDDDTNAGTSLAVCIDRLTARLGAAAISRPTPYPSHYPERSQRGRPVFEKLSATQAVLAFYDRPLKILDRPEPIDVIYATPEGLPRSFRWRGGLHTIKRAEGPERIAQNGGERRAPHGRETITGSKTKAVGDTGFTDTVCSTMAAATHRNGICKGCSDDTRTKLKVIPNLGQ
jgi:hypothetical protein